MKKIVAKINPGKVVVAFSHLPIVVEIVEIVCLKRQKTNDKGGRGWFIKIALS